MSNEITVEEVAAVVAHLRRSDTEWTGDRYTVTIRLPEAWPLLIYTMLEAIDDAIAARWEQYVRTEAMAWATHHELSTVEYWLRHWRRIL